MDTDTLTAALTEWFRTRGPMELVLRPTSVLELAAALQLAKRHPRIGEHALVVATIDRFLEGARAYFAESAAVLEVLRQGDDARHDLDVRPTAEGLHEAAVTINGRALAFAEVMALRVAVSSMRISLDDPAFRAGLGAVLAANYNRTLATIEQLLIEGANVP